MIQGRRIHHKPSIDFLVGYKYEFCYGVYNQCESFICLDLMVKNREVPIEMYFKWWTSTKLVWIKYQNYYFINNIIKING
jgi:hypothetical protein